MRSKKVLVGAVLVLVIAFAWWKSLDRPVGGGGDVMVTIPKGASARTIGQILESKGIIRSAFKLRWRVRSGANSTALKPGVYEFSPSMSLTDVLRKIRDGEVAARWITFPEGFTIRQMGERLEEEGCCSAEAFTAKAMYGGLQFNMSFVPQGGNLEGYLFPDTYAVPLGASEDDVIGEMLNCFDRKVVRELGSDIGNSGWGLHEILTLASLIEREARAPKDRPLISAVLRNRLQKNMRLQCDATVLYAMGMHKDRVLNRDLEVDSPYNTYRVFGLSPGPIASPGLESIKAALHPADVDYLFYVAKKDGSHIFTRTYEEHLRAIDTARGED